MMLANAEHVEPGLIGVHDLVDQVAKALRWMDGHAEVEYTPANCHAREVLARIGDKWSVYVIHALDDAGTLRFNELRAAVDGISQRMLTVTLRGWSATAS